MSAWFAARWVAVTSVGLALTLVVLLLASIDAPAWARTPLAVLVMLGATGFALVGPGRSLAPALRWSLVLGLSIAVDFLYAELLLRLDLFTLPAFLMLLLVTQLVGAAAHLRIGHRRAIIASEGTAA